MPLRKLLTVRREAWRTRKLALELRVLEVTDVEERNEATTEHTLTEALTFMEHLSHTVGG